MNLDKALELLDIAIGGFPADDTEEYYKAMELGIEALKFTRKLNATGQLRDRQLLLGETKD